MKNSLPSFQTSLPQVSTYNHGGPSLHCLCVYGMHANTYGMYVWRMPYMSYVRSLNFSIHIYTQPYLFFPTWSDGNVFEKWIISAASFSLNSNTGAWQWEGSFYLKKKPISLNPVRENKTQGWCSHLMDQTLVGINCYNLASITEAALITCACESESRFLVFWPVLMSSNDSYFIISRKYCAKDQPCVHGVLLFVLAHMCGAWHWWSRECLSCSCSTVLQIGCFPFLLSGSYF